MACALFSAFIDHPVADLFRRPAVLKVFNHSVVQVRMSNEFALC